MPSRSTHYDQPFNDNWPDYEYTVNEQSSQSESTTECTGHSTNAGPGTGPTLRRSRRNTHRPARYADTWACK